jgi:hypothetical protein
LVRGVKVLKVSPVAGLIVAIAMLTTFSLSEIRDYIYTLISLQPNFRYCLERFNKLVFIYNILPFSPLRLVRLVQEIL